MTKKLKIAAAVLVPLMAWGGFKFYQFYDETLYHIKDTELPNAPLFTKIDLSKKGVTQFDFEVDHNNRYAFRINFFYNTEKERDYLEKILGNPVESSIKGTHPIMMHFTLTKLNSNMPVFQRKAILEPNGSGFTGEFIGVSLTKSTYRRIILEPGKYRIVFENLTGSPAYENVHTELAVSSDAKWYYVYQEIVR